MDTHGDGWVCFILCEIFFLQFYQVYKKWNVTLLLCVLLQMICWMKFSANEQHGMEKCFNYFQFSEICFQITWWFFDSWLGHWSPTNPAKWDSICSLDFYSREHLENKVVAKWSSPDSILFPSPLFICKCVLSFTNFHFPLSLATFVRFFERLYWRLQKILGFFLKRCVFVQWYRLQVPGLGQPRKKIP